MIHLATGIALRGGTLLMVASRYANQAMPLWNLPGGRQLPGELLAETVAREVLEETGLRFEAGELAYVSESYAGEEHFLNATFLLAEVDGEPCLRLGASRLAQDCASRSPATQRDHVVEVAWVPLGQVARRIAVAVVREPLLAYLNQALPRRYAGFHEAGVTIEWPDDSQ